MVEDCSRRCVRASSRLDPENIETKRLAAASTVPLHLGELMGLEKRKERLLVSLSVSLKEVEADLATERARQQAGASEVRDAGRALEGLQTQKERIESMVAFLEKLPDPPAGP